MVEVADSEKRTHKAVHYGAGMGRTHCSNCKHYIQPSRDRDKRPHCEIVEDPIGPRMWCEKFRRAD